jgi:thioredoxin reductase
MSSLVDYPVSLPTRSIPPDTDASAVAKEFVFNINSLEEHHFVNDAIWRDTFALTGTLRTFYSASSIATAWKETSTRAKVGPFAIKPDSANVVRIGESASWLQVEFSFETNGTPSTACSGYLSLVPDEQGGWQIWLLRTVLEQLKGQGDVNVLEAVKTNGTLTNGHVEPTNFDCVVIGGGQAGLSAGGRMKALGISYVIIDKNPEVGDSWKRRYNSARLHTTREYAHLPFDRTFPDNYQEYLTKDDLAQGYKDWVAKFGINVWQKAAPTKGTWDPSRSLWTLNIKRGGTDRTITCSYIVLAGGGGSQSPITPTYADREVFEGTVLHSVDYKYPSAWKGQHGVVVGTANTAHDIADDMLQAGLASTTMVQRGTTYVLPAEWFKKTSDMSYNAKIPTEVADRAGNSNPYAVLDVLSRNGNSNQAKKNPERFDALEKAGFKVDRYGSIMHHIANRMGGHYMDVGVSAKIANGEVSSIPVLYTRQRY